MNSVSSVESAFRGSIAGGIVSGAVLRVRMKEDNRPATESRGLGCLKSLLIGLKGSKMYGANVIGGRFSQPVRNGDISGGIQC